MIVVDVDGHQEPSRDWLVGSPLLREQLVGRKFPESDPRIFIEVPTAQAMTEYVTFFGSDAIQRDLPRSRRRALSAIVPEFTSEEFGVAPGTPIGADVYEGADQLQQVDPQRRVAWLDEVGIAYQTVVPSKGYVIMQCVEDPQLAMAAVAHLNTHLSDRLHGYTDRLNMVTSLRYEDIDWCVKEMTRMRERGSRTFFLPGEPVNLVPPYDPYFDPVWAAACDLGMVGLYHVGASLTKWNPGWGNTDDPNVMSQVNAAGSHFNAHIMINAMIFGGVFHRYPNFTMQISEFGFEWLPYAVRHMDKRTSDTGQSMIGKYAWPLKPSEFVRRNVRMSGLPGQDPRVMLETMPEAIAFASDYPHMEGSPSPIEYYSPFLQGADEATRSGYFADNMLEVYARMGDPLPVPA